MLPGVHGSTEEHDIPVRPRHVPDVRRSDARVPHLPQTDREEDPALLTEIIDVKPDVKR